MLALGSEYQKFLFDNFVISCDEEKCVAEPVVPISDDETENVNEIEVEHIKHVIPEPIEVPFVASYSQDELDAAVKAAEERAYEKGFKSASGETEQQQHDLLNDINGRLMTLLSEREEVEKNVETDTLRFVADVVRKILPSMEKEQATAEVSKFLTDNFSNFRREISLSFSFNPEVISAMPELISKLADRNDFEGKIAVHKDASLGLSDCRVEWQNGGVERNTHKMLEKIDDLLDDKSHTNKEREHG